MTNLPRVSPVSRATRQTVGSMFGIVEIFSDAQHQFTHPMGQRFQSLGSGPDLEGLAAAINRPFCIPRRTSTTMGSGPSPALLQLKRANCQRPPPSPQHGPALLVQLRVAPLQQQPCHAEPVQRPLRVESLKAAAAVQPTTDISTSLHRSHRRSEPGFTHR
ncbi:hypothetical protein QAD02_005694 [Eretmocerus hayati]|uniref:Uncharacterized protein n=1 Tax=Eretmocerus hayati TaxID=131215 RepID=A0ACC2NTP5_9HYME|nr:hypothetical protein QAD02_005694 [Eretmocerus hayati]